MKPFRERWVAYWKGWEKDGFCCPNCGRPYNDRQLLRARYGSPTIFFCIKCGREFAIGLFSNIAYYSSTVRRELFDITKVG